LVQGFTTRYGGVSAGDYASFNLNFNRPDPKNNVYENYRLLGSELGIPLENMVLSYQVHDKKVLPVTKEHAGMGIIKERNYQNADGLATSQTDLLLVTHYADCVPLYFYDPVKKIIALSHSGWKGTLLDIAGETVKVLKNTYGCSPENLHAAFGPHIKQCCFEVGDDVAKLFQEKFTWAADYSAYRKDGKWLLDLEGFITESLLSSGVVIDHISGCTVCTRCNKEMFFSHRGSNGKTGTGAAFIMIRGKS
jgi:YfiH family protein